MNPTDWPAWHAAYADPESSLSRRLEVVRAYVRDALALATAGAAGPVRVVSLCAGDGRDLLPVLAAHAARDRACARLVEQDAELAAAARRTAATLGLARVEVYCADAGRAAVLTDGAPWHVVLACGVFGNVTPADAVTTLAAVRAVLAPGGVLIWTRGRGGGDAPVEALRSWLGEHGAQELAFVAPSDALFSVGMHRFPTAPSGPVPTGRLFTFVT